MRFLFETSFFLNILVLQIAEMQFTNSQTNQSNPCKKTTRKKCPFSHIKLTLTSCHPKDQNGNFCNSNPFPEKIFTFSHNKKINILTKIIIPYLSPEHKNFSPLLFYYKKAELPPRFYNPLRLITQ